MKRKNLEYKKNNYVAVTHATNEFDAKQLAAKEAKLLNKQVKKLRKKGVSEEIVNKFIQAGGKTIAQPGKNILEFKNITKTFLGGKVIANNNVSFTIKSGHVHALIGENGSGKSTLMSILFGLYKQDSGQIYLYDQLVDMYKPGAAKEARIGMVHQHFHLVNEFTVLDNILIGQEEYADVKFGVLSKRLALRRFNEITTKYKITLDPNKLVRRLSVGERQKVEILKVLWQEKDIIIFDEPTATLSVKEIDHLMGTIEQLKKEGKTILFISHKLQEVKRLADRITILRKGVLMNTFDNTKNLTINEMAKLMVGQEVTLNYPKRRAKTKPALDIKNLNYITSKGFQALTDINLTINKGEIFGLAGIEGNGQEEIISCLTGLKKSTTGEIYFEGKDITNLTVYEKQSIFSHIPIDRKKHGIISDLDLDFNAMLTVYDAKEYSKRWVQTVNKDGHVNANSVLVDKRKIAQFTDKIITSMNVEGAESHLIPIRNLSGGNQQKFVIGREMNRDHKLLIAGHPTRGLDIKAIDHIYKSMINNADKFNKTTLLYSLEITELMAVCDRIAVLYKGKIVDVINPKTTSMETMANLMVGVKK